MFIDKADQILQPQSFTVALASDFHADVATWITAPLLTDLLIVAGDIAAANTDFSPIRWLSRSFPDQTTLFIPGNRDFYGSDMDFATDRWRREAEGSNIHVLCEDTFDFHGVRFLGTPLWSDLAIPNPLLRASLSSSLDAGVIADFVRISRHGMRWSVAAMLAANLAARDFLDQGFVHAARLGLPTVVITHWPPLYRSCPPILRTVALAPYFLNNLQDMVARASLWLHGHQRHPCAYATKSGTQVFCHPRGCATANELDSYRPRRLSLAHTGCNLVVTNMP